jgi:hypothetical protein
VIWFVDPAASGPGTGRLSSPFTSVSSADAVSGAFQRIFVASGSTSGSVTQSASEWLVGAGVTGASFDAVMGVTPPAGTMARPAINGSAPAITGGVTLGAGSVVRGVSLTPASGTAGIAGLGASGVTVGETSVTATSARALDVVGSQGSTISLTRASASGGVNGIRLNTVNTTTPGSVTVTGTGSAGSGGVISGSTGAGVSLTGVKNVSLSWLTVSGSAAEGVSGSTVEAFSMTDSTVSGGTHGIAISGPAGAVTLTRVTAFGAAGDNARVFGSSGTSTVTVTDSTFRDNNATSGGNGLLVEADGSATMTLSTSGSSFLRNRQDGLAVYGNSTAKMTATVTNGTWVTVNGVGIEVLGSNTGGMAYTLSGGSVTGAVTSGAPVVVYKATGATGTGANAVAGSISGMTISNGNSPLAPGIWVRAEGAGASRVAVTNILRLRPQGLGDVQRAALPINQNQALFSLLGHDLRRRRAGQLRVARPARARADPRRQRPHAGRAGRRAGAHAVDRRAADAHARAGMHNAPAANPTNTPERDVLRKLNGNAYAAGRTNLTASMSPGTVERRRQPGASQHAAVPDAELLHRLQGIFPSPELRRTRPWHSLMSARSGCSPATSRPPAGCSAKGSCCRSPRTRRCSS